MPDEPKEAIGRHYLTGEPLRARRQKGGVLVETAESAPEDTWIAPALFDVQVNGYAGVDFQQDGLTVEQLFHAARELRAAGCAQFLVTLITDEWPRLMHRLEALGKLRAASAELERAIAGRHIEGPFLLMEPGVHGAH